MISDSTPLIILAKTNQLNLLKDLFGKISIPQKVKEEVIYNEKGGSQPILKAISERWIIIEDPKEEIVTDLDKGENAALSLAKEKKDNIIIDDARAMKAARAMEIPYYRTTSLLFLAIKKKIFTKKQARSLLTHFLKEGYYLSPHQYATILDQLL